MATTSGVDFMNCKYDSQNGEKCKVKIWDTAGQEKFRKLVPSYFKQADGIIFAYDLTVKESFTNIPDWIQQAQQSGKHTNDGGGNIPMVLVGNKLDLVEANEEERRIKW